VGNITRYNEKMCLNNSGFKYYPLDCHQNLHTSSHVESWSILRNGREDTMAINSARASATQPSVDSKGFVLAVARAKQPD
jgi:hypothetical protein